MKRYFVLDIYRLSTLGRRILVNQLSSRHIMNQ